jgi:hypothetical protein
MPGESLVRGPRAARERSLLPVVRPLYAAVEGEVMAAGPAAAYLSEAPTKVQGAAPGPRYARSSEWLAYTSGATALAVVR